MIDGCFKPTFERTRLRVSTGYAYSIGIHLNAMK